MFRKLRLNLLPHPLRSRAHSFANKPRPPRRPPTTPVQAAAATKTSSTSLLFSKTLRALLIGTPTLILAYAYIDTGFQRSLTFWSKAAPIYAVYRYKEWEFQDKTEEEYDQELVRLHNKYADNVLSIILDMKGFYIKIGQMGSQRDDFVHEAFLKRLRTLQNSVPPRPISFVYDTISSELGRPWSEVFSSIDEYPLGAASIGQVHRAILKDTNEVVCIKLQYPNVEKEFSWDMTTIKSFVKLAVPAHLPFFNEIEKQFASEFDYRKEADNLIQIRRHLLPLYEDMIEIPMPRMKLTTKRMLTMNMLNGRPLPDEAQRRFEHLKNLTNSIDSTDSTDSDMKVGLSEKEYDAIATSLSWMDTLANTKICIQKWTVGFFTGSRYEYQKTLPPLNLPRILKQIWDVHGHELLLCGCFNGDPHPGNILILENGKIGLIDYGQVKRIKKDVRINIAKMCVALCANDEEEIVRIQLEGFGLRTQKNDPWVLGKHARVAWDNAGRQVCEGLNVQLFAEKLDQMDPIVKSVDDLVMPIRMCMMIWGLSYYMKYTDQRVCVELLPKAKELLLMEEPDYLKKYPEVF
jgi:aarF domain-containing kinase